MVSAVFWRFPRITGVSVVSAASVAVSADCEKELGLEITIESNFYPNLH